MPPFIRNTTPLVLIRHGSTRSSSTKWEQLMGPAVKLMLGHYQVEASRIQPTGPKKNLVKSDVAAFISQQRLSPKLASAPTPSTPSLSHTQIDTSRASPGAQKGKPAAYIDIPLTGMRSTIAKRLSASKSSIPHAYLSASISTRNIRLLRRRMTLDGVNVSLNDFVIKAVALALRAVPQVNAQWSATETVRQMPNVDVSVAVATPSGLITPIVTHADRLGVEEISAKVKELAERARQNKLKPQEFQGGTFTVSNLGMFGISHFTAIINPPQVAILAVGGVQNFLATSGEKEEPLSVTLCYDSRAIDEASASLFMAHLGMLISEPETMLSGTKEFANLVE